MGKTIKHYIVCLYTFQNTQYCCIHTSSCVKYNCGRMKRLAFLQSHVAFRIMFHEIIVNLLSPGSSLDPPHISMIVHNTQHKKIDK